MAFKLRSLAELCRQMKFAPRARRLAQVAAAEDLLLRIDPEQAYPPGFVVHAVTGYHSKDADAKAVVGGSRMTGVALQHDLGLLVETVTADMDLAADDETLRGEPVLDLAAACDRFGVTTKTLQRWRRRGLPARRLVFADGKQRVGFRLSCAERFFQRHETGTAEAPAGTSAVVGDEVDRIVRRARRLAAGGHDRREIVLRVARVTGRSTMAVRSTLDAIEPTLLASCPEPLAEAAAAAAADRVDAGEPVALVAASLNRPRSAIYRATLAARAERLASATTKFHDDALFHGDPVEAERQVRALARDADAALSGDADDAALARPPRGLPPYLADLYRTPLLTPARERAGFLLYNFHKCRFAALRGELDPHLCRRRDVARMERHLAAARDARNDLLRANLRLVVHVARKHLRPGIELMDLVSDGNVVLMRAVEGFDVGKGFKFSTYATLALMKGFARSVPQMQVDRARGEVGLEPGERRERTVCDAGPDRVAESDELSRLMGELDDRERSVIAARWGLSDDDPSRLADAWGVTGRRLRQIEARALDKLRDAAGCAG